MIRHKHLTAGKTHTVETFWNQSATAFFRAPEGSKINVKYGKGRLSKNVQMQTLNGSDLKRLTVNGKGSLLYARMRVKVAESGDITYDVYPGELGLLTPKERF